jgi:hypothetical protein
MKNPTLPVKTRILFLLTLLCAVIASLQSIHAATITVTNTDDSGGGSLRQALADAFHGDTINFDASVTGTITLTSGELPVGASVTISGPGANTLAVDGNTASRVFFIASGQTVTISGLTITNGSVSGVNGGGGIYNDQDATLTVNNCTVSGNSAVRGGGIYNFVATLIVNKSTLSGNSASGGAGIENFHGTLRINNTTLSGNSADAGGGGIYNNGGLGGACATLIVNNSTLSGNSAGNFFGSGGGIRNDAFQGCAELTLGNTILKAGSSGENISADGTVTSLGYNLSSDDGGGVLTATTDQINTDPQLGPLQDNGGPTFTHLPSNDSPAVNAGDPTPETDQRGTGFPRVANNRIDIGAVEVQAATPAPAPVAPTALDATNKTASSFAANWSSVSGGTGYRLDVSTSNSFVTYVTGYQDLDVGNVTTQSVTGLAASTFYYYRLRAYNGTGTSPNSNVVTVKTKNH